MIERLLALIDHVAGRWLNWRTDRAAARNPLVGPVGFKKAEFDENGFHAIMSFPGVTLLANDAADMLDANDCENYIQFDMLTSIDKGQRPIRITVQWVSGESPAGKAFRLERELERLRGEAVQL